LFFNPTFGARFSSVPFITDTNDLTTKGYVDSAIASGSVTLAYAYFYNIGSQTPTITATPVLLYVDSVYATKTVSISVVSNPGGNV
jgi:hypothetical protein